MKQTQTWSLLRNERKYIPAASHVDATEFRARMEAYKALQAKPAQAAAAALRG